MATTATANTTTSTTATVSININGDSQVPVANLDPDKVHPITSMQLLHKLGRAVSSQLQKDENSAFLGTLRETRLTKIRTCFVQMARDGYFELYKQPGVHRSYEYVPYDPALSARWNKVNTDLTAASKASSNKLKMELQTSIKNHVMAFFARLTTTTATVTIVSPPVLPITPLLLTPSSTAATQPSIPTPFIPSLPSQIVTSATSPLPPRRIAIPQSRIQLPAIPLMPPSTINASRFNGLVSPAFSVSSLLSSPSTSLISSTFLTSSTPSTSFILFPLSPPIPALASITLGPGLKRSREPAAESSNKRIRISRPRSSTLPPVMLTTAAAPSRCPASATPAQSTPTHSRSQQPAASPPSGAMPAFFAALSVAEQAVLAEVIALSRQLDMLSPKTDSSWLASSIEGILADILTRVGAGVSA
ncbi:hypothetical protein GQ42DRAFT_164573 [Ramicandelaber brevisporus]|nr:hypothetical protein GQ42DRAFT_164573 [Ramicandelaber brevisporus]